VLLESADDELAHVLGAHVFTTAIGRFNLDFVLATGFLNLSILALNILELHRLHLNNHSGPINFPEIKRLA